MTRKKPASDENGSVRTRFKKGQSGNPKGRPNGSKNMRTIALELAEEIVVVTLKGKQVRMTQQEVLVRSMYAGGMKGNPKHIAALLMLLGLDKPEPPEPAGPTGVLIVPQKCANIEEWVQEHGLAARTNKPPPEAYERDPKPK